MFRNYSIDDLKGVYFKGLPLISLKVGQMYPDGSWDKIQLDHHAGDEENGEES